MNNVVQIRRPKLYWAYGSNLDVEQMKVRCPRAVKVGPLYLDDGALVFRHVADVVSREGSRVAGGLWRITNECEATLDRYEGVASGLYEKRYLTLQIDGKVEDCLFYKMVGKGIFPPSEGYLEGILRGYRNFGLDETLLHKALEHSWNKRYKTPSLRRRFARKGGVPNLARTIREGKKRIEQRVVKRASTVKQSTRTEVKKHWPEWPSEEKLKSWRA